MGATIWWLFFSMSAGISFFWSFILLFGKSVRSSATRALGFLLLTFSLTLVHYVLVWSDNVSSFPHLSGLWRASCYLYGPLLLPFFIEKKQINWKYYLPQFIPFLLLFIAWLPFAFSGLEEKIAWMNNRSVYHSGLLLHPKFLYLLTAEFLTGSQLIYGIFFLIKSIKLKNGNRKMKIIIAGLFLLFIIAQIIYFILVRNPEFKPEWDYMISLAMTFCIFGIALMTFYKPEFFFQYKHQKVNGEKYNTSSLTNTQSAELAQTIKSFVEKNQSFLDPDLRLPGLAEQLQLNSHQLSQAINENFNSSFSEWINQYRIEYACELLATQKYSAKEAGFQSGFNSISSFYQIFKKSKGITPARFSKLKKASEVDS